MKLKTHHQLLLIVFLAAALIMAIFLVRSLSNNPTLYGGETFNNLRTIESDSSFDDVQDYNRNTNLYWSLLSFLPIQTHFLLAHILPLVLGIVTLVLVLYLNRNSKQQVLFLGLFAFNPVFLYIFSTFSVFNVVVPLFIAGYLGFRTRKGWWAFPFFVLITLIDPLSGFISILVLLIYALYHKYQLRQFYVIFVTSLIALAILLSINTVDFTSSFQQHTLSHLFAEFGAFPGIVFSMLLLGIVGVTLLIKQNKHRLTAYVLLLVALIFSNQTLAVMTLLALVLPLPASKAIDYFSKRKWNIELLKPITILLIFCSLLFPVVTYTVDATLAQPTKETITALALLESFSTDRSVVLSSEENGYFIQYFAKRKSYLDASSQKFPLYDKKKHDQQQILFSRQLENTTVLLNKYKITHFYIDPAMRQNLWNNKDQGLLFLLESSSFFEKHVTQDGYAIYVYT